MQRATAIPSGAGSPAPAPTTQHAPAPLLAAGAPVRSLTPARALAPVPTPAAPAAGPRRATPVAVPLRRTSSPGSGPAVQRAVAPSTPVGRAVPLLSAANAKPGSGAALPVVQRHASTATHAPAPAPIPVQRDAGGPPQPAAARTTTAVSAVSAHGTSSRGSSGSGSASDPPAAHDDELPPEYTPVAKGQFDPRSLTDFQLDELTHRLIGRITRLVRTELRLDRERIGKLRDPRH
ncbi:MULTISPECIES: extensin [unclassified Streptomyces]|uniref:extensin n=1 Tax=unclassified Streptomyces TaxID=2593676 RepID=UPI003655C629